MNMKKILHKLSYSNIEKVVSTMTNCYFQQLEYDQPQFNTALWMMMMNGVEQFFNILNSDHEGFMMFIYKRAGLINIMIPTNENTASLDLNQWEHSLSGS